MVRKLLLVGTLAFSVTLFAQTSATSTDNTAPPGTGGSAWTGVGPAAGVVLATPTAAFESPQSTAGISLAGRAGISNSNPANVGIQSTLGTSSLVYISPPAGYMMPTMENENPATSAVSTERANNDLLPATSFVGGGNTVTRGSGLSLAEIAERYKVQESKLALKTVTNADVPRENAGLLGPTYLAENRPPAIPQQQTAPATSQSTEQTPAQTASSDQQEGNQTLPTSASPLPLLGLLGVVSGGVGLWFRRKMR